MSKLERKIAVITGVSEGIGSALSFELLKLDYKVVGISSNKDKIINIKKKFSDFHDTFFPYCADVRNFKDIKIISKKIRIVDLLILNAGIYLPTEADKPDLEIYKRHNDINYMGVINTYSAFISKMVLRKKGTILIMSSIAGWLGLPKASAYGPTKSALRSFAQSARFDLEKHGIKIKLCSPGFVNTPATQKNDFYMPSLIESDLAAKKILNKLTTSRFEITFPFIFSYFMRLISLLPFNISFRLIKKITLKND